MPFYAWDAVVVVVALVPLYLSDRRRRRIDGPGSSRGVGNRLRGVKRTRSAASFYGQRGADVPKPPEE